MKNLCRIALCCAALVPCINSFAQTATEKIQEYKTYDYSDPNPVPIPQGIYPYFRYDGFTRNAIQKDWKVVELENDYIKVKIFPEIGGKIWSIYDKTRGKELFYDNDVVKFRDISLRGPWTSGGIEFNYGVVGHAPSCFCPVDYKLENKADGSVSCYIGVFEMLSRTRWMVEINLPKDAVYVRTRSFWHNASGNFQPYYTWANSGIKVSDDMKIIYPANYTIEHWGLTKEYPVDEQGRDISIYANQAYGHDKSYHAGGSHKAFFGAHWPSENFGMLHYALRDEKLGRKYFSWSQSGEGSIWIDLLTDNRPQYVELQSGRLFNQNLPGSDKSPYKQIVFSPYGTDEWNEYWMPFSGLDKVDEVSPLAVVEVGDGKVDFYSVCRLKGEMKFIDGNGKLIESLNVDWEPAKTISKTVNTGALNKITINGSKLWSAESQNIDRPREINPQWSDSSVQGLTVQAYYNVGTRKFALAQQNVDAALAIDPAAIGALNIKAFLEYRRMSYDEAYQYSAKVLAIDQYNAYANYIGGLAAAALCKTADALDHFEIAAITAELRSASCMALAKIHFKEGDLNLAKEYLRKSLIGNAHNLAAYQLLYQIDPSEETLRTIDELDHLCHFGEFENMLAGKISAEELANSIKEEMRWQDYMEYAVFCNNLGLVDKALRTLEACPDNNALIGLWKAYLKNDASEIASAEKSAVDFVFPFRGESAPVLEWAVANRGGWVSNYLLAILNDHLGNTDKARTLVSGVECGWAPFYSYRATLTGCVEDMKKAIALDGEQWRYVQNLAMHFYLKKDYKASIAVVEPFYKNHRSNFRIGDTYVKNLMALGQFTKAEKEMEKLDIIPFEGQSATRIMYRDIKLNLAAQYIDKGKYRLAVEKLEQARLWPEQFGVGKPYEDLIDTKMEDILTAVILKRQGKIKESEDFVKKVLAADPNFKVETYMEATGIAALMGTKDSTGDKKLF